MGSTRFNKITNQHVLMVVTVLFGLFVVAEIIGAIAGNSLSLLGDAAAMSVDVFTYFTNMWAERVKSSGREIDEPTRMMLEVYIPSFSVCALLGVTIWITCDAINVIISKGHGEDEVNVYFLYGFASVDVFSSAMFACRGSQAFKTIDDDAYQQLQQSLATDPESDAGDVKYNAFAPRTTSISALKSKLNLNMFSALTHLGGDTLRTASVFIAAVVATVSSVSGNLCDAWAAIIVTVTIVFLVCPLIYQIIKAANPAANQT